MQNDKLEVKKMFQRNDSAGRKLLLAICCLALPLANVFADYVDANGEEYLNLDYIAATGSQWMVTDIRPTCTDTVKMKFRLSDLSKTQALYCSRTTMTTDTFTAFYIENVVRCDRNANTSTKGNTAPGVGYDTIFVADYATRRFSVNGLEQDVLMAAGDYTPGSTLMLFASHKKGNDLSAGIASGDVDNRATYRLYYYELYAHGSQTPKHRLVPARRASDHVVGLYDTVVCKFYGPADNSAAFIASSSIRNVTVQQRYPWNGKVDISYTVIGDIAEEARQKAVFASLKVTATDGSANTAYTATRLSGDLSLEEGTHAVVWDMGAEGLSFKSSNVVFKVACETTPAAYCVVDLSAGSSASSYPVTYLAEPPSGGFNTDEYKTTKLVLKRIESGSFVMGADQTEESHRVTLTKPFFCGIFEVTQKQYELVAGAEPCSSSSHGKGNTYPVHYVSYNMIRGSSNGAKWPSSSAVDSTSFMGMLRARTGLDFDLPTEAQWEYACRAGTTTTYYWGNSMNGNYAWYADNSSDSSYPVGTKTANAWGLYDMSGNVWEWCLDWYGTLTYGNAPEGLSSGKARVRRGGSWGSNADACTSFCRFNYSPSDTYYGNGFRMARTLPSVENSGTFCSGIARIVPWDLTENLVAHYTFDGNANDTSGNGNDGVLHDVTGIEDRHGNAGGAYHFNGTSAYIEVPDSDSLREVGQTITLSAWVKPEAWDVDLISVLCKAESDGKRQYSIQIFADKWVSYMYSGVDVRCDVSKSIMLGKWSHVVMTYTPTQISSYLNGELVGVRFPNGNVIENTESLYIGIDPPGIAEHFIGDMDEVRIYNRALSVSEVRALANSDDPVAKNIGDDAWIYQYDFNDGLGLVWSGFGDLPSVLNIPGSIDGKQVVQIGSYAFYDCTDLEQVVLPNSIGTLTVGGNAFNASTTVEIESADGYYFGGWTNATGVIISDPFHSPTAVTVAPRWMEEGTEYAEHLIFFEDFERGSMEFDLSTVGTFPYPACIQDGMGVDGSRGFGFGRSSCNKNAWFDYVTTLTASFGRRYFITRVEFDEMERYGNLGSSGNIIVNRTGDEELRNLDFCRVNNDGVADTVFRHRDILIGKMATNICFQVVDITGKSEEFIDNVKIYGRLARQCAITMDANGGIGDVVVKNVLEGDDLTLEENTYVRTGYQFLGWSTSADDDVVYADCATIPDVSEHMDGAVLYAAWKPLAPDVFPSDDTTFLNASQTISLFHDSGDTLILYTTDGSDPKVGGIAYKGPFAIYESCTVRAIALGAGRVSDEVSVTLTRAEGLSVAANMYGYLMETDEAHPWTVVTDVSHDGVSCVRSGAIGHGGTTWLQTSLRKAGTVSFWWRAACEDVEEEYGETYWYDYGTFSVDGELKAQIAGSDTGWRFVSVDVPTGGKHLLRWEYTKDGVTTYSPDCIWLDQVQWIPADGSGHTLTTPNPVPYSWLSGYGFGLGSDFETAAKSPSGKKSAEGRSLAVWEDYVAGTDPTDVNDIFRAMISFQDGTPLITWTPDLNTDGEVRVYRVLGKKRLTDPVWQWPVNSSHRFFKVRVELP